MSDAFVGEIRMTGFGYAPTGWASCDGQVVPLQQNAALYSLLGITFGGNGVNTFALPNLQGASPLGPGTGPGLTDRAMGAVGGADSVTLTGNQLPSHSHAVAASTAVGTEVSPAGGIWAVPGGARGEKAYAAASGAGVSMAPGAIGFAGGGEAHDNRPPYLAVNFIICMIGLYPSRS